MARVQAHTAPCMAAAGARAAVRPRGPRERDVGAGPLLAASAERAEPDRPSADRSCHFAFSRRHSLPRARGRATSCSGRACFAGPPVAPQSVVDEEVLKRLREAENEDSDDKRDKKISLAKLIFRLLLWLASILCILIGAFTSKGKNTFSTDHWRFWVVGGLVIPIWDVSTWSESRSAAPARLHPHACACAPAPRPAA